MSVSAFLLVAGPEWVEVPNASVLVRSGGMEETALATLIQSQDWAPITSWAEEVGLLLPPTHVVNAQMFDVGAESPGEINVRLWLITQ
jgi:hypothetical protein